MFVHGSSFDCVGEPSETDGDSVGCLARQTAEVAQQTVETWPAGVDGEEIGTFPTSSGDIDLSERTDSMPWRSRMPAFSTKTTVIKACTRVLHPLTEVVMIWRT